MVIIIKGLGQPGQLNSSPPWKDLLLSRPMCISRIKNFSETNRNSGQHFKYESAVKSSVSVWEGLTLPAFLLFIFTEFTLELTSWTEWYFKFFQKHPAQKGSVWRVKGSTTHGGLEKIPRGEIQAEIWEEIQNPLTWLSFIFPVHFWKAVLK